MPTKYDPRIHHRRSIRLPGYDYSQAGSYFMTVGTHGGRCWLGTVEGNTMYLSEAGWVVQSVWESLPRRFPTVELDSFVIMPNHLHGIITVGAQ